MEKYPKVVVLILSYNGKDLLDDSISSYQNNRYSNFNVVVIDNGSSDGTKEYVNDNFPGIEVLSLEDNLGYSGGFNKGIKYVMNSYTPDYILVSNNDVEVDVDVISSLVKTSEQKKDAGFVTGKVYFHDYGGRKDIIQTFGKKFNSRHLIGSHIGTGEIDKGQYDKMNELDSCDDVFTLVSKKVILETKGYDENFFHEGEELDWQLRAKQLGFKIFFAKEAKIWHKVSATTGGWQTPLIVFYSFRNQILIMKRHSKNLNFFLFMIKRLLYVLPANVLSNLSKSRPRNSLASIKGTLSGLKWVVKDNKGVIQ